MELQKAHHDLNELNKNLETIVQNRTERVQQLLKQKDDFVTQLGHDLKTPLGPLINLLPVIEKHEADSRNKELLEVVNRNVGYMKNLVTKTIQLAQLQSPQMRLKYERFNLGKEIKEIIETNKIFFDENQISINIGIKDSIDVSADKLKIQEVINNLLNNAVKYSNGPGCIKIYETIQDDQVIISIHDTGQGLTSEQIKLIFDEFYKVDESRHDFDSSGLGLSICKRIVEMHGGRIWAESEGPGKGSTFSFSLPLNQYFSMKTPLSQICNRL